MTKSLITKLAIGVAVLAAGGILFANFGGNLGLNGGGGAVGVGNDGTLELGDGVSTNVSWEDIEATRGLVNTELAERKSAAADKLGKDLEKNSDDYWDKRRALDAERTACESEAQLADPCKDLFEQAHQLAQDILNNLDEGFDEEKFQEREGVKKEYDNCLENPPRDKTTAGMMEQCAETFATANQAALDVRTEADAASNKAHDDFVKEAEADHARKMAELDALDQECKDTELERRYGSLPGTGIPVTDYQGGSPACTGIFPGNDPDLAKRIANLQSLYNQAKAGGGRAGFLDASTLGTEINRLKAEMAAGDAKCTRDEDCGGPVPVCCNIKEIGRAFCSGGICANEKTMCGAEEVCAGKPAMCLALIQVIDYQGSLIPTSQLRVGQIHPVDENGGCEARHWHADSEVTALDGNKFTDPDRYGCGFGTLTERPAFSVYPPSQDAVNSGTSGTSDARGSEAPGLAAPIGGAGGAYLEVRGGIFGN